MFSQDAIPRGVTPLKRGCGALSVKSVVDRSSTMCRIIANRLGVMNISFDAFRSSQLSVQVSQKLVEIEKRRVLWASNRAHERGCSVLLKRVHVLS
jgi:hypothetical protein